MSLKVIHPDSIPVEIYQGKTLPVHYDKERKSTFVFIWCSQCHTTSWHEITGGEEMPDQLFIPRYIQEAVSNASG